MAPKGLFFSGLLLALGAIILGMARPPFDIKLNAFVTHSFFTVTPSRYLSAITVLVLKKLRKHFAFRNAFSIDIGG
jgi:hypothetical protein